MQTIHLLIARQLRVGWRRLSGDPAYALIVILGLAVAIAISILSGAFVRDKLWADSQRPDADRLVSFEWRVRGPGGSHTDWFDDVPAGALAQGLRESGAPIAAMARARGATIHARVGQRASKLDIRLADPQLPEFFALKTLAGDLAATLASPAGIALTEEGAEKLFGNRQVLGRQLTAYGLSDNGPWSVTLTVMAVLAQPGHNSMLGHYEALAGFGSPPARLAEAEMMGWWNGMANLYARLAPGASAADLDARAQALLDAQPLPPGLPADFLAGGGKAGYLRAMPFSERGLNGAGSPHRRLQMLSLGAAALATLALAAINYVNLSSVRTLRRQREIGLRKSLGAGHAQLLALFFGEATLVALLAGLIGLLLAWWLAPGFETLMEHRFDTPLLALPTLLLTAAGCVLLGLLTGTPLAGIALRVNCAASLAGRDRSEGQAGRWLRRGLTMLQFAAAAGLSALALMVLWQNEHASRVPRGFEIEDRLSFDMTFGKGPEQHASLLQTLARLPGVQGVTSSADLPGRNFMSFFAEFQARSGAKVMLRTGNAVGPGFFEFYGVPLLAGRLSGDHVSEHEQGIVLDRSAALALGYAHPQEAIGRPLISKFYRDGKPHQIVAVVADLRLESTREAAHQPTLYKPVTGIAGPVSLRSSDAAATRLALAPVLAAWAPDEAMEISSVAEQLARQYEGDRRIGWLVALAGLVALLMAGIGIYALAAYSLRLRTREIVLRKLHGAGAGAIARLLLREFGLMVLSGSALGLPLAWFAGEAYLGQFAQRAAMGPWPMLGALLVLVLLTAMASARHLRAALALRPALALQ